MHVNVRLFAAARVRSSQDDVWVDIPDDATVGDLKGALVDHCPELELLMPSVRIAINHEYALDDTQVIPPGAELAAIPPVSGGSPFESARP